MQGPERALWVRWVGANTLGETIGLGFSALVAVAVAGAGDTRRLSMAVAAVVALGAAGAVEGVAVGYAQWRVLRGPLAALRARSWVLATAIGAVVAWSVGMVPSTLAAGTGEGGAPPFSDAVQFLLAALMGLVLGPVLGVPQWRVLRRFIPRAGHWVLANGAAWAAGMPVIFLAAGSVPAGAPLWLLVTAVLGACAAAGAVVGAVHGVWLVWLLRVRAGPSPTSSGTPHLPAADTPQEPASETCRHARQGSQPGRTTAAVSPRARIGSRPLALPRARRLCSPPADRGQAADSSMS